MRMTQLLLNRIRTPDGTELTSWDRHDYKSYTDKNGYAYVVDGGTSYLRRAMSEGAPEAEELSQYLSDDHAHNREYFNWGTYGKGALDQYHRVFLKDLDTDHIENILKTEGRRLGDSYIVALLKAELEHRTLALEYT